jgi:hypothetical protein
MTIDCTPYSLLTECTFKGIELSEGRELVMPTVVVGLIVVLILFFLYATVRLYWSSWGYQRRLQLLTGCLDAERTGGRALTRAALNRVGDVLGKDQLCAHGWREFNETLVVDTSAADEAIYNTRQANEFFSEDEIVSESMHPTFFQSVPGILTSIGLLGTFLAILLGLAAIHVPGGEEAVGTTGKIVGIGDFINALSGKFVSSVLALMFAIGFTLMETRAIRRADETYRRFCQTFDAVFPRRTAEELLNTMAISIQNQGAAFEHFNTDLSARFRDGVAEGLGPVLQRISNGLLSLTGERDNNIEALMEKLTKEFREAMSQSAGMEFDQVATAVKQASELIAGANTQTERTQESFNRLVATMETAAAQQEQMSSEQAATMQALLRQMVNTMGNESSASKSALDQTVKELVTQTQKESKLAMETLQETMAEYGRQQNVQTNELMVRVDVATSRMESAGVDGSKELADTIQRVSNSLEENAARVSDQMKMAASGVVERTGNLSQQITEEFGSLLAEHRESLATAADTREALERTLVVWNQGTNEMRSVSTALRESSESFGASAASAKSGVASLAESQQRLTGMFTAVQEELRRLESMKAESGNLLAEHQRVFHDVRDGLGAALDTITTKLQTLQEVSSRGLTKQLSEFDNHLGTATQKLGAAVDELSEVLDGATDEIRTAVRSNDSARI